MKTIYRIFRSDLSRIGTNVVAVVVIMGLSVLPCLYAWFNIMSNWDPYSSEATSRLRVAVVSQDEGASVDNFDINVGDLVIKALKQNKSIGWEFKYSSEEAIDGVNSGDYYAALVIPENFSENMLSFINGDLDHPTIHYYENKKKNAIAPKITGKAQNTVSRQINEVFVEEVTTVVMDISKMLYGIDTGTAVDNVTLELTNIKNDLNAYIGLLDSFTGVLDSAGNMITTVDGMIPYMQNTVAQAKETVSSVEVLLSTDDKDIQNYIDNVQSTLDEVNDDLLSVRSDLKSSHDFMLDGGKRILESKNQLKDLQNDLDELISEIKSLTNLKEYKDIIELLSSEGESIGSFVSSPVKIKTKQIYPVKEYGSTTVPFYTILAIWVGALILVVIVHVRVNPEMIAGETKPYQEYFGRYCTFFAVGQIQTLIIVLGELLYLRIQCLHPFLFWLAAAAASLTFTLLIYSLTYAFGSVGEAIALIILVIQVAGAGGTYPIEVLPKFYQSLYQFMPFSYCMNALRETIGGMYDMNYWKYLSFMVICIIISLSIGLLIGRPFNGLKKIIKRSKENASLFK